MTETNLVDRIAQFIQRFVFLKDKQIYRLLALWVIQTHLYRQFEYAGYIFAHSCEPQSGKSRLLEVLDLVVFNSSGVLHGPTPAVLFRMGGRTQIFDEVDAWPEGGEHLRGMLNAGFKRGSKVERNERQKNGNWQPVSFDVYAPRAMAGIGDRILHGATKDRTFLISMVRRTREEPIEKFRLSKVKAESAQLMAEIQSWAREHKGRVADLYENADTKLNFLSHLRDRTQDIVEPLAAILDTAYKDTKELPDCHRELLEAVKVTRKEGGEFLDSFRILHELSNIAALQDPLIGSASELAAFCALDPQPSEYEVGQILHRHGFETRSVRIGDIVRKKYELSHVSLADICARLL